MKGLKLRCFLTTLLLLLSPLFRSGGRTRLVICILSAPLIQINSLKEIAQVLECLTTAAVAVRTLEFIYSSGDDHPTFEHAFRGKRKLNLREKAL